MAEKEFIVRQGLIVRNGNVEFPSAFTPTIDNHGSPKKYVDDQIVGHNHDTRYLSLTNTTPFLPNGAFQPATKKYVDDNAITGSTTGGAIELFYALMGA
jgi:hypothetical protein